ncbi:endolytic transglycosylase MltG [Lacticaseibacillus brantae]|uniref:Endolytic murein transglycosylase n=1 Tax=Lacticaseibacillus brantae DSM 23927 TaxID=1423727 RepID=A0A0R2B264_9LACO|nr:endolytic transglycosylase MltG [Lacticaseibacillus brantae]KRM72850.1 aminodeoxychorismate lyase [Lacticaseibacillus brantae DSM 23927]
MASQKQSSLDHDKKSRRTSEKKVVNKIVLWIVGIMVALLVIIGFMGYRYVDSALQPVDSKATDSISVKIPIGSTSKDIASALEKKHVIKSATVFNYYVKFHNFTDFQAGTYEFTQADTLDDIINELRQGGDAGSVNAVTQVLVKEGVTISDIAKSLDKVTKKNPKISGAKFLALMKDKDYFEKLEKKYPKLLSSDLAAKDVRYHLEGYLFPATYGVSANESLESLVDTMVEKTDSVMQSYYGSIKKQGYSVQEVMTLASLVEREGVTEQSRRTIAGVFLNRLAINMPIQSDITVMYALNTHKTHLTNKDTSVDSPYNLYKHTGYGPGPFNQPSLQSIRAVLSPTDRDKNYLYFVANLKTGEILYATTREQHDVNTAKFASDNGTN